MPKEQNYNNHIRFYPPHHFVFYPVMLIFMGVVAWFAYDDVPNRAIWIVSALIILSVILVSFMLRQHYALTLQNRLVLQELRYRYFVVTGQRFELIENRLEDGQLFALRFAPDEELKALADRAVTENLSPDAIKKAVKNWRPDYRRV